MITFSERFMNGIEVAICQSPVVAVSAGLCGYIYATLANLPAIPVAKAAAIWMVAEQSILTVSRALITKNPARRAILQATILIGSTAIGIQELQKRGLIGNKMVIFLIIMRTAGVFDYLSEGKLKQLTINKAIIEG